mgnify:CR=1 FL=1
MLRSRRQTQRMYDTIRFFTMSAADYLDEYFESDVIKGHLSGSSIIGTALGPRSPGTAFSSQSVKRDPFPRVLSTVIWPAIIDASRRLIASPSPVPECPRVNPTSPCTKGSNIRSI